MNSPLSIVLFVLGVLVLAGIIALVIACKQVTKTYSMFSFAFNSKYWCLALLNYRFSQAKEKGLGTKDFIKEFSHTFLAPSSNDFRKLRITSENRVLIMKVLSDPEFLEKHFAVYPYDLKHHDGTLSFTGVAEARLGTDKRALRNQEAQENV